MEQILPRRAAPARVRVAIVGGGVIGLAIGWRLAEAGAEIDIFEQGQAGRGASWAAAGMLASAVEAEPGEAALLALLGRSHLLWPGFAQALEAASGSEVGLRGEGTLAIGLTRDDAEQLRFAYELQRGLGLELEWLSAAEALRREPQLNPRLSAAYASPRDGQVDNRLVVTALIEAFRRSGGRLHEHAAVEAIDIVGAAVQGVVVAGERRAADYVILAAGAWSRGVGGLPSHLRPPVRPVKGQMLAVAMDARQPLLSHVIWAPRVYLVPRRDGRLIIGGTVEERGFDASLTAGAVLTLIEGAWRALPAIEERPIAEMWVGFRPGSRDDAPILGPTSIAGLVLACGHYRNGILLTPITAEAISAYVLTGAVPESIRAFGLDRFDVAQRPPGEAMTA